MQTSDSSSSTSTSLIERARQLDPQAWRRLCAIYGPLVYHWARRAGLQDNDAADVGQEVFRTVVARIGAFEGQRAESTFRGWLWTITRNKIGDHLRGQAARPRMLGDAVGLRPQFQTPLTESDASSDADGFDSQSSVLHHALTLIRDEFEDNTWQAFWRSTVDRQTTQQIGEELGMTPHAARQAKYRVLKRLRIEMAADEN